MNLRRKQEGAALFIALIVLVIITFLGINALKSSSSDARIVTSTQAESYSFSAAESAINKIVNRMEQKDSDTDEYGYIVKDVMDDPVNVLAFCINNASELPSGNNNASAGNCGWYDKKEVTKSWGKVKMSESFQPSPGWSLNGDVLFGRRSMVVVGYGEVPAVNTKNVNVQNLGVFGPMTSSNLKLRD